MKIAIVQHDIPSSNFFNNMDRLDPLLKQQPDADMYVLPETFATGFMAEGYVGGVGAPAHFMLQWMAYQAMLHNAAIVGSVAKKIQRDCCVTVCILFAPMARTSITTSAICLRLPAKPGITCQAIAV